MTLKVLSVDDSFTFTTHLEYMLKDLAQVEWVGHAYTLRDAEKMIIDKDPDVVLLDIMIDEENGFDLLELIKTQKACIDVFILSNLADTIYIKKSKMMGAVRFIDKSFEFNSIPIFLKEVFDKKYLNN